MPERAAFNKRAFFQHFHKKPQQGEQSGPESEPTWYSETQRTRRAIKKFDRGSNKMGHLTTLSVTESEKLFSSFVPIYPTYKPSSPLFQVREVI